MPRQSNIDFSKIQSLLEDPEINCFDARGKFRTPKDEFWINLSKKYGSIDPKYLYTIVSQNRHNVLNVADISLNSSSNNSSFEELSDNSAKITGMESMSFIITLEPQQWRTLFITQTYSDEQLGSRKYETLQPRSWTDIFNSKFFEETRLPCTLVFKRVRIHPTGNFYLKFSAHCSQCESELEGIVVEKPNLDDIENVSLDCHYKGNFKSCNSTKKRRIVGERRHTYAKKLIDENMSASFLCRKEAKNIMKFGEQQPSHLPSNNALRLLKSRTVKKMFPDDNPILSLSLLKVTSPYSDVIRDIGLDEFFVHYWAKTELNCYRLCARQNKFLTVSIDATGSVVQKIKLISGTESRHIFLYEVVIQDTRNNTSYAVSHMLSSRHNSNAITFWLQEWVRSGIGKLPSSVITDSSLALMHAVSRTFTQYSSLWAYLNVCSNLLLNPELTTRNNILPKCFIRNDFNHTMHTFSTWNEIKTATKNTKNFYMRSLALIVATPDFETVKELIESLFIVLVSRENGGKCQQAKTELKNKIAGRSFPSQLEEELYEQEIDEPPYVNEDTLICNSIADEIDKIFNRALKVATSDINKSDDDNVLYNENISLKLRKFCKLLPIWSAIMVPIFGYGNSTESSAASEGSFNDVKNRIFQHKTLPLRADDFITTHCDAILGKMNLVKSEIPEENIIEDESPNPPAPNPFHAVNSPIKPSDITEPLEYSYEQHKNMKKHVNLTPQLLDHRQLIPETSEENWRGLNELGRPLKKRKSYLTPDPTILHVTEKSKAKTRVFGLLKNGNILNLQSVMIDGDYYCLINTCPFDTVIQILFTCYADSEEYSNFVDINNDKILFEMIKNANRDGITVQTYRKRAHILVNLNKEEKTIFEKKTLPNQNHFELNCASTAYRLIQTLMASYPTLQEIRFCTKCPYKKMSTFPSVTINLPTDTIQFFEDSVTQRFTTIQDLSCPSCKEKAITENFELGKHLFFELSGIIIESNKKQMVEISVTLADIPTEINVTSTVYKLRGAVSFISPSSRHTNAMGHYVAYCYRMEEKRWELYDDLRSQIRSVRANTIIQNCQFLIYSM